MRAKQLRRGYDIPSRTQDREYVVGKGGIGGLHSKIETAQNIKEYGFSRLLWTGGDYLVRGRNPGGSNYAGVARLDVHESDAD